MLRFKQFSNIKEGFGEGADSSIGALPSSPAKSKPKKKTESGQTGPFLGRSDFIQWHTESGPPPKFNKHGEHGGMAFYAPHEKKK